MEHRVLENLFLKLSECFLSFSSSPEQNINRLVCLCGELMGATCGLYNRLDNDMLCSVGRWNAPSDCSVTDRAKGHICYDVVLNAKDNLVVIRNLQETSYFYTDSNVKKYNLKTYIGRAVKIGDSYIGALCVVYQSDYTPSLEEEELIGIIASAIGIEEERNRAREEIKKGGHEKTLILNNMLELVVYQDMESRIIWANKTTADAFNTTSEELKGKLCYQAFHKADKACADCPVVRSMHTGHVEEQEMVATDDRVWIIRGIPIRDNAGKVTGILEVARDITESRKSEKKMEALNKELFKSNKKLQRLVIKDPHTGLYNHRYFKEIIDTEFYRAKRYHQDLSLIFIDIDYFRSVNDVYGYNLGDIVLRQFAQRLKKLVRLHDYAVRFGDEEFAVILPGNDKQAAFKIAQRIEDSIKTHALGDKDNRVKLRLSMAVISYPEDKLFKGSHFIEAADKILNLAKERGGDSICSMKDAEGWDGRESASGGIKHLRQKIAKLTKKANQSSVESIFAFAKTIELKDHYTGNHVEKTVYYATEIARLLGLPEPEVKIIERASMLHDLGKIGISEKILLKKGPLTKKEFEKIKEHPGIGADILRPIQFLHSLVPLIRYHHERWDGKGYPSGLKGEEIPVGARIIAIADVYEALISDRPYRKAFPKKEAVKIIKGNSGSQFDPKIAEALLDVLKKGRD